MAKLTTKERIIQLIKQDDQDANVVRGYYQDALNDIKNHLTQFYIRYAKATGLSVREVQGLATKWDIQQFKQAIQVLDENAKGLSQSDRAELTTRRKVAITQGISPQRQQVVAGIISAIVLTANVKTTKHLRARLLQDAKDEIKFQGLSRERKRAILATVDDYTANLSSDLWNKSDTLNYLLHGLVNKKLSGQGITAGDLQSLFPYLKPKLNQVGTATELVHSAEYRASRALRWWSSREVDDITMSTFRQRGVTEVDIVNEPGACQKCVAIAEAGPYRIGDAPELPIHNNCRCHKEARRVSIIDSIF